MRVIHHEIQKTRSLSGTLFRSMREIVFGLEDGVVSTLGAITGIAGGTMDSKVVILSGLVIIFVESLSMAAGTYLSNKAEKEGVDRILKEEAEEIENHPEQATRELEAYYREMGFGTQEVQILVEQVTKNKKLWIRERTEGEIGVAPVIHQQQFSKTAFMWASYAFGGLIPLSSYFFLPISYALPVSLVGSVGILFAIGFIKGQIVRVSRLRSGLEMLVISVAAAGVGYLVGRLAATLFSI